jgi:hypothetical protein
MIDDILLNLKIISKIPENGKIRKKNNGILNLEYSHAILSNVIRKITGYGRNKTILDIERIINEADDIVDGICHSRFYDLELHPVEYNKKNDYLKSLYIEMINASSGLHNLRMTYKQDVVTSSRIDLIIERIKIFIRDYNYLS